MKLFALIVESQEGSLVELKRLLGMAGVQVLEAHSALEASQLLKLCPHLIMIDLDSFVGEQAMDWVEKVKASDLGRVPIAVFSRQTTVGRIQRAAQARVVDYILMPPHIPVLSRKVADLCARARSGGVYEIQASRDQSVISAKLRIDGQITGISETGLQVGGSFMASRSLEALAPDAFETALFKQIGVRSPALRLTNAGKSSEGGGPVNYFQIQGWSEDDRKMLRHWILGRRNEAFR